jgi:mycofactocin precursor
VGQQKLHIKVIYDNKINQRTKEEVSKRMKEEKDDVKPSQEECENTNEKKDVFSTKEIKIEEMAIDGICGVY